MGKLIEMNKKKSSFDFKQTITTTTTIHYQYEEEKKQRWEVSGFHLELLNVTSTTSDLVFIDWFM